MKPRIKLVKVGKNSYKWYCGNETFPVLGESPLAAYNYWCVCYPWLVEKLLENK